MMTDRQIRSFLARANDELDCWYEAEEVEADAPEAIARLLKEAVQLLESTVNDPKEKLEDPTVADLLRRAVTLMLDKLNEHNPETGFLFAIDHGLTEHLTMLTLVHACARDAIPMARALETIKTLEEKRDARHTGTDRCPGGGRR
jgi:hypothetical protein